MMRSCRTAGWPARGPVTWTSCACAVLATSAAHVASASARSVREGVMLWVLEVMLSGPRSARLVVIEIEREEDRRADLRGDVVGERGAARGPVVLVQPFGPDADRRVLQLL